MDERRRDRQRRRRPSARPKVTGAANNRQQTQQSKAPEVVYTPAKPFNRNRLLLHLATVLAVVLAVVLGMSIFFKVKVVQVSGNAKYDTWTVREASGIRDGDGLLSFGKAKASSRILEKLPYVESVQIGIKLPDTVNITITEYDVYYAIRDIQDGWWLINAQGKILEKTDSATAGENTKVLGIKLENPLPGKQGVAQEPEPIATDEEGEVVSGDLIKGSERLSAALKILGLLEKKGILGEMVSVDVSDMANIICWYGEDIRITMGDTQRLEEKVHAISEGVQQLESYDRGVLDVSFTITPDRQRFDPVKD